MTVQIMRGDARRLPLADASVHAVVCDPPYGLEFMGREWDRYTPAQFAEFSQAWAAEAYRVLKPGGWLLAFGGTRTWHRLCCGIEDAGLEIRDTITWLYGSGFAKSWNFNTQYSGTWCECNPVPYNHASDSDMHRLRQEVQSPSIARLESQGADLLAALQWSEPGAGLGDTRAQGASGLVSGDGGGVARVDARREQPVLAGRQLHRRQGLSPGADGGSSERPAERLRAGARAGDGVDDRSASGTSGGGAPHQPGSGGQPAGEPAAVSEPHGSLDDGALRDDPTCSRCGGLDPVYRGFGTGIKPASEPIVVARKPLAGTVAGNVLTHGTGALNIDACRVESGDPGWTRPASRTASFAAESRPWKDRLTGDESWSGGTSGRWPSNVVLSHAHGPDGGDACADGCVPGCPVADLDRQSGVLTSGANPTRRGSDKFRDAYGDFTGQADCTPARGADSGSASRFFPTFRYTAKAPTSERPRVNGVAHPTVKPLALMRWLLRLVVAPGGLVLDPFAGSGTTAEAALLEGFDCITSDLEVTHLPLIEARRKRSTGIAVDVPLFGEVVA